MGERAEGRREMDFSHPTPHTPQPTQGGGGRGETDSPRVLSSLPQSLTPPLGSASLGMVDSGYCQGRVCSLNPRPTLPNFPLSLPSLYPF